MVSEDGFALVGVDGCQVACVSHLLIDGCMALLVSVYSCCLVMGTGIVGIVLL